MKVLFHLFSEVLCLLLFSETLMCLGLPYVETSFRVGNRNKDSFSEFYFVYLTFEVCLQIVISLLFV